ncbi:adenylyl cyclase [Heterostelium album PN500]|uniref:adenylate cyclase n=1 Tax=Heterostelium pallidum (strain ATCC 26659 / Pp 5 / PN500) TaxID=670386 RepID=D3BMF0_HETP5|nr:adenylyl cyclase [Heterostelium album PN500]EFA77162.1 adenylyl cyclase [Heterostelium album PN500]|eukprot:XP_020429291.1 adenylyl cyclase [Heterostelium album PN500]
MSGTGSSLNLTGSCYGASFTSNSHNSPITPRTMLHQDSNGGLNYSSLTMPTNAKGQRLSGNFLKGVRSPSTEFGIEMDKYSPNPHNFLNNNTSHGVSSNSICHSNTNNTDVESGIGMESLVKESYKFPLPFLNSNESELYKIDIENPLVWNNLPIDENIEMTSSKDNRPKKPTFIQKYRSGIPKHLELEYLSHHFYSSINLLRAANIMGMAAIIYDGFQAGMKTNIELIIIRVICLVMLATSITLSFLKNKIYYRRSYVPLFIISYTAFYLTFMLEYTGSLTTLVLFLYAVLFCSLYALGCLMTRWIICLNLIVGIMFIIFLLSYQVLDTNNLISYIIYIVLIFLLGGMNLFVLEQSRKDAFLDSKNLQKKTESLRMEKARSDQLLNSILPDFVIKLMNDMPKGVSQSDQMISRDFPNCSLLYCDIVDFTNLASKVEPSALVRLLNEVFSEFDRVVEEHNCEKIKTDGDAYLCAGGLTIENENHFNSIIESALTILNLRILKENCLKVQVKLRVGVASGSVIGGVIGCEKFQFDVWGEAIAKAHVLEETGQAGKIHLSKSDLDKLIKNAYHIEENNETQLGEKTFFIIPETVDFSTYQQTPESQQVTLKQSCGVSNENNNNNSTTEPSGNNNNNDYNIYNCNTNNDGNIVSIESNTGGGGVDSELSLPVDSLDASESQNNPCEKRQRFAIIANDLLTKIGIKWNGTDLYSLSTTMRKDLSDVEKIFKDYTKFNRWIVQFRNWSVEKAYHEYVIENTLIETRIFLFFGVFIHFIFFIDDRLMSSKAFSKPVIYQASFLLLLIIFCISTIIEFIRYGNPLARSSLTRVLLTLLYANLFYSLNFVFVTLLNILVFSTFLLVAFYLDPKRLPNHIYPTDYIGGFVVLTIQIYSSYIMKLGMRRIWILKSKIKFKGLNLKMERMKSSRLLENIMPDVISKQLLKQTNNRGSRLLIAQNYSKVAVMFINITGFDQLKLPSGTSILKYMNYIFTEFDKLLGKYDLEKIKTIGTTYMVVAGLTKNQGQLPKHYVGNLADMALTAKALVHHSNSSLSVQIGINYGCCVAGCIGIRRAKFDVWGDTANIASRMQTSTPPGKIQITSAVTNLLHDEFFIEERGIIPIKGRGEMSTYYLSGRRQQPLTYNANSNGSNNNEINEHLPLHWYKKTVYQPSPPPPPSYSLPNDKE